MRRLLLLPAMLSTAFVVAQVTAPLNGPKDKGGIPIAFIHATVHPAPGEVIRDATVLIQDEHVLAIGPRVNVPVGAVVHDLRGATSGPGSSIPTATSACPRVVAAPRATP